MRALRPIMPVVPALLAGMLPASACSCMALAPESYRAQADVILTGRVLSVSTVPPHQIGTNRAVIRVVSVAKGGARGRVTLETRNQSAACGIRFTHGETREFLARRDRGRLVTDSCLMIGARGR